MACPTKTERNAAVVAAYHSGLSLVEVGRKFGINHTTAHRIITRQGARLSRDQLKQRWSVANSQIAAREDVRQRKSEKMREHWQSGRVQGKPTLFAHDPARREDYLNLRNACGCAYARKAMGIA